MIWDSFWAIFSRKVSGHPALGFPNDNESFGKKVSHYLVLKYLTVAKPAATA
jgi:hypothetical protein